MISIDTGKVFDKTQHLSGCSHSLRLPTIFLWGVFLPGLLSPLEMDCILSIECLYIECLFHVIVHS